MGVWKRRIAEKARFRLERQLQHIQAPDGSRHDVCKDKNNIVEIFAGSAELWRYYRPSLQANVQRKTGCNFWRDKALC